MLMQSKCIEFMYFEEIYTRQATNSNIMVEQVDKDNDEKTDKLKQYYENTQGNNVMSEMLQFSTCSIINRVQNINK